MKIRQLREIETGNGMHPDLFDTEIENLCERLLALFPSEKEQKDNILVMEVTVQVPKVLLGKVARLCNRETKKVRDWIRKDHYELKILHGDINITLYAN